VNDFPTLNGRDEAGRFAAGNPGASKQRGETPRQSLLGLRPPPAGPSAPLRSPSLCAPHRLKGMKYLRNARTSGPEVLPAHQ
jgi:hypothetical protein